MSYDIGDLIASDRTLSMDEIAEEAAWTIIEMCGWVPTPELLFALKEDIRQQMMGG